MKIPSYNNAGFSCGRLDSPENGRVSLSGVSPGSVATYTCNVGFDLVGVTTRVCLSSGQWSGDAPVCQGEWSLNK